MKILTDLRVTVVTGMDPDHNDEIEINRDKRPNVAIASVKLGCIIILNCH